MYWKILTMIMCIGFAESSEVGVLSNWEIIIIESNPIKYSPEKQGRQILKWDPNP